jgi:hypothetical protein
MHIPELVRAALDGNDMHAGRQAEHHGGLRVAYHLEPKDLFVELP